jgi:hypothetical protein
MSDARWKNALWNLLDILPLRRITARIALSAGLISLATQSSPGAAGQVRVPVSPVTVPEATVRRLKGRYVLKRVANALTVRFAGHVSHSSHASHASHSSHSSSSHYSGAHSSHFSSSPTLPAPPTPQPELPRSPSPRTIGAPSKAVPILKEEFDDARTVADRWRIGVLATPAGTFDPNINVVQSHGSLNITPIAHETGAHFSGYVSIQSFDLTTCSIAAQLRRPAQRASTIFAAAIDAANWRGFRIEGGQLWLESHTNGRVVSKKIPYRTSSHRFLRLRASNVASVVVWETSADGRNWNTEHVETASINVATLHIALSAGTTKSTATAAAAFDSVIVERKP